MKGSMDDQVARQRSSRAGLRQNFKQSHHPRILVLEDMAVIDILAEVDRLEPTDDPYAFARIDEYCVLPATFGSGRIFTISIEHLPLDRMRMERMRDRRTIRNLPDLRGAFFHCFIDTVFRVLLAVNKEYPRRV